MPGCCSGRTAGFPRPVARVRCSKKRRRCCRRTISARAPPSKRGSRAFRRCAYHNEQARALLANGARSKLTCLGAAARALQRAHGGAVYDVRASRSRAGVRRHARGRAAVPSARLVDDSASGAARGAPRGRGAAGRRLPNVHAALDRGLTRSQQLDPDLHWLFLRMRALARIHEGDSGRRHAALMALVASRAQRRARSQRSVVRADACLIFQTPDQLAARDLLTLMAADRDDPPNIWALKVRT